MLLLLGVWLIYVIVLFDLCWPVLWFSCVLFSYSWVVVGLMSCCCSHDVLLVYVCVSLKMSDLDMPQLGKDSGMRRGSRTS